ncbi:response regulator [Prolixibacteraceae bacterium JC049]|nr:response regulator [Prolixibacteraceae bacterium JC049]
MSAPTVTDWSNKTIMVVEDEEVNVYFFQAALKKTKANVIYASNGREAIEHVQSGKNIDIILMDIRLPEIDGYEATRKIKEISPNIPIIAQTAYAMANEREEILSAGCDDYISKPIRLHILIEVLEKFFNAE